MTIRQYQILDVDMSGLPCGPKAAFASKGYFAKQRNRRGRQLGRVLASRYEEVVVDRLFDGTTQLTRALQPLMVAAEETLRLDQHKRERTMVRIDAVGAAWMMSIGCSRGYQFHCKDYSGKHAQRLAQSVQDWYDRSPSGRTAGRLGDGACTSMCVRCGALRCAAASQGQWGIGVLISTLSAQPCWLSPSQSFARRSMRPRCCWPLCIYDQRGGGVETSFKGDHQGLGSTKRSKKRFEAQQMVMLLGSLAHNVVIWARQWLTQAASPPAAALWDTAHGARCVPCQWLSGLRCPGPPRPDCAEPSGTFGTGFSSSFAPATGWRSGGRSIWAKLR